VDLPAPVIDLGLELGSDAAHAVAVDGGVQGHRRQQVSGPDRTVAGQGAAASGRARARGRPREEHAVARVDRLPGYDRELRPRGPDGR
jgi:hypothetical protein